MRMKLSVLNRYIVTPRVAKYRLFVWFQRPVLPDTAVVVVCRDDDTTFGILHSRFHEAWSFSATPLRHSRKRLNTWNSSGFSTSL